MRQLKRRGKCRQHRGPAPALGIMKREMYVSDVVSIVGGGQTIASCVINTQTSVAGARQHAPARRPRRGLAKHRHRDAAMPARASRLLYMSGLHRESDMASDAWHRRVSRNLNQRGVCARSKRRRLRPTSSLSILIIILSAWHRNQRQQYQLLALISCHGHAHVFGGNGWC